MTPFPRDRWSILSPLLDQALELESSQRTAWLSDLQKRDPAIAADLQALLEEHAALTAQRFLEGGAGPLPRDAADPTGTTTDPDTPGAALGPYRLVSQLGVGGMGVVWLARQEHPIRRLVAVKLVRPGVDSKQVLSRFEAERQALAILNHSGIAKVFEAGTTQDGRPYFVMEHIAGSAITDFADDHQLAIAERLRLFVQACDAVHHAHQKGVLHRDLKPKNMLVAVEDGQPIVKVIDFGVAKALGQHLTDDSYETEFGAIVGTREYMSPEQAGLVSAPVDARTDVYSLGLVLYELLAGAPPVDHDKLRKRTVFEAVRAIREENAPPLTKLVTAANDEVLKELARSRRTEPRTLIRDLHGDLEWVAARAIVADPARRYATVSSLRDDIDRHLKGEPVSVGPPSPAHKLRKLARQHRAAAAAAFIVAVGIVVSAVVTTVAFLGSRRADAIAPPDVIGLRSTPASDGSTSAAASMPLPLTSFPGTEGNASWSPDGRKVAFTWNGERADNFDIHVVEPGSNQTVRLTTELGTDSDPAWSPDGRWIAYVHTADERQYSLNMMPAEGGRPRTLMTHTSGVFGPAWTPDGRRLVVQIVRDPQQMSELWAVSVATGERRQLTFPPAGTLGDRGPALSPDGKALAFCRKTGWRAADLYLMDVMPDLSPATQPRRVTDLGYVDRPAWTPDGSRILFEASGEGAGIWQLHLSDRRVSPVLGPPQTAAQPALVKRLGGHVSLIFTNHVVEQSIWRYSIGNGPRVPPLEMAKSTRRQTLARYSNDGKKLAFSSDRSGSQEIWVANADGADPIQLTNLRHNLTEMGHWSPTDDVVAFVSHGRGLRELYLVGSSGGTPVSLTKENGLGSGSGWSRDGGDYYYTSSRTGRNEVWKVSRRGGQTVQVTQQGGENGFESNRGDVYYWRRHPDRGPLLIRRTTVGDNEVALLPRGDPESQTVLAPHGFYYRAAGTADVVFYDERSGRSARVLDVQTNGFGRFTVSPDGRWFIAALFTKSTIDLMIMEHFK